MEMECGKLKNIYGRLRIWQCDCPGLNEGKTIGRIETAVISANRLGNNEMGLANLSRSSDVKK
jgi:hypothetical protein